jgi:hypothetical protein
VLLSSSKLLFISRTLKLDVMWFSRSGSTRLWRLKTISKVSCDGGGPGGGGEDILIRRVRIEWSLLRENAHSY